MVYGATFLAAVCKSVLGLPLLLAFVVAVSFVIVNAIRLKNAAGQRRIDYQKEKKKYKMILGFGSGFWIFLIMVVTSSIGFSFFVGYKIYRKIVEKYGVETEAVVYKISDTGMLVNYQEINKYHFVFQLPDNSLKEATLLDIQVSRGYGTNKRIAIKYLPLTVDFYPMIIDVND
ncbi:hypothetical protein [Vaginella massiliensis]|uniref:hypothetical protein n=1 Tax=Vaginella massiliensis TaxID=1816680 RepID=UPI0008386A6D|nr:hypothetical protein [Vaginella massiliensis]